MSIDSSVVHFFGNKTVLITGASGFLGKCLLHRLLHQCPHVAQVQLLLRPKSGQTASKRLETLLSDHIFATVSPEALTKVKVVSGDVTLDDLALSPIDRQSIIDSCHVILHCAATIRFDEPIRRALQLNVASVQRVLRLAQKCLHLEALVHVSTAYCTRDPTDVMEQVDSDLVSGEKLLESCAWLKDDLLDAIGHHFLTNHRFLSSYHFSKSLAEHLLLTSRGHAPVAIVRPSIIVGAVSQPEPGWTSPDNFHGIAGFLVATGKGVLRTLHCDPDLLCDVIPVDVVANTCLVAAHHVATERPLAPLVVNCVSGPLNPVTWGQLRDTCLPLLREFPSSQLMRAPEVALHSSALVHCCHLLLAHSIPRFVVDLLFRAFGLEPILGNVYQKVNRSLDALTPFTTNEWRFRVDRQVALADALSKADREAFPIDVRAICWPDFFANYVKSIRKTVLKESDESLPRARRQLARIRFVTRLSELSICIMVIVVLLRQKTPIWKQFAKLLNNFRIKV